MWYFGGGLDEETEVDLLPEQDHGDRQQLARLFYVYAYRRGRFLLTSGRESGYYLDGKQVIYSGEGLACAARLLLSRLKEDNLAGAIDAVGGPSFGAAPLAAAVSLLAAGEGRAYTGFAVRKESKEHGTRTRINGPFFQGIRTIIVDDVLTTGSSLFQAERVVREEGGRILGMYVLVDRLEGGREAVEKEGHLFNSLITRTDIEAIDQHVRGRCGPLLEALEACPPCWERVVDFCRDAPFAFSGGQVTPGCDGTSPSRPSLTEVLCRVGQRCAALAPDLPVPSEQYAAAALQAVKGAFIFPEEIAPAVALHRLA